MKEKDVSTEIFVDFLKLSGKEKGEMDSREMIPALLAWAQQL